MTSYTKRDIKAADILAMILVGFGVVLFLFAIVQASSTKSGKADGASPSLWIVAGVFVVLGTALNLKIRQLVRNRGHEPEDYPGSGRVPSGSPPSSSIVGQARDVKRPSARIRLLGAASMAIGSLLYLWYGPTAIRQQRWMGMAREHVPVVETLLRADVAFEGVQVGVGTGGGGTLLVVGSVRTQAVLQRLQAVIAESKPPVEAAFTVRVE